MVQNLTTRTTMDWLTILWSMAAAACLTLAIVHVLVWIQRSNQHAYLVFAICAVSVAAIALLELSMAKAKSPEAFGRLLWWLHVPLFFMVVAVVLFIRLYFGTGRWWLLWATCGLRAISLILNFLAPVNVNWIEITELRSVEFLGSKAMYAVGIPSQMTRVGELSSLFALLFVIDASWASWKKGDHRRTLVVGGGTICFILLAAIHAALLHRGIIDTPYFVALSFVGIVGAMAFELGVDAARSLELASRLEITDGRLREEQSRIALAESAGMGLWVWDLERNDVWATTRALELFGLSAIGRPDFEMKDVVLPDDHPELDEAVRSALSGSGSFETEHRVRLPDGSIRWLASVGQVDRSGRTSTNRIRGCSFDITPRKLAEAEARQHANELMHLSRVNIIGALSGSIAHELNQPLTAILSNAQAAQRFLARDEPDLDEVRDALEDIVSEDRRAGEVIRNLRALLRRGEIDFAPLSMNEVVTGVLTLLRAELMDHGVIANTHLDENLPMVTGNRIQLQQVLLNLTINARDAVSSNGGRSLAIHTGLDENGWVHVRVEDDGPGVALDEIDRLFEPFYTTKSNGLGLGLAVCRTIAEAHGGRMGSTNNPTKGATFHLWLPVPEPAG